MDPFNADSTQQKRLFDFRRCLGIGGFGEVYLATMTSSGGVKTDVAVKVLHRNLDPSSQAVQRLRDEGRLLGILNHPSILRVNDLVVLDGHVSLVTEYVAGEDLDECLKAQPPLSSRALLEVIGRVADALHSAYNSTPVDSKRPLHLIHRDVKPANIRIGRHGDVKLLDFGIAWATHRREAKTQTNAVIGSSLYMAPERLDDDGPAKPSSDVFSLGCVLYEGLAGKRFLGTMSLKQQFMMTRAPGEYETYKEKQLQKIPRKPEELIEVLTMLLDRDPSKRPAAIELSRFCDDLGDEMYGQSLRRWCQDRKWPRPPDIEDGGLTGRVISERILPIMASDIETMRLNLKDVNLERDSNEGDPQPTDEEELSPEETKRGWWLMVLTALIAAGLIVLFAIIFAGAVAIIW
ncbi:MAG: serine/threonine protein kinase [Proteobacteria bacterium]|jgi:serine/threonine protein kinase|nr:serine/threonine protein kinase [Pseudomonadota bacterium]